MPFWTKPYSNQYTIHWCATPYIGTSASYIESTHYTLKWLHHALDLLHHILNNLNHTWTLLHHILKCVNHTGKHPSYTHWILWHYTNSLSSGAFQWVWVAIFNDYVRCFPSWLPAASVYMVYVPVCYYHNQYDRNHLQSMIATFNTWFIFPMYVVVVFNVWCRFQ